MKRAQDGFSENRRFSSKSRVKIALISVRNLCIWCSLTFNVHSIIRHFLVDFDYSANTAVFCYNYRMSMEQKLDVFEKRPAVFSAAERERRAEMLKRFSVINRFEGLVPSPLDKRLFELLAAGKINKVEYLNLCLSDARASS